MSTELTVRMLKAYFKIKLPTMFLSSIFKSPPQNFYNGAAVEIDIMRTSEQLSIAVENLGTGYRYNASDLYTNKLFIAPVHREAAVINAENLIKRMPGENPFKNPNYQGNAILMVFKEFRVLEAMIRRSIEQQASQILQTGILKLVDRDNNTVYEIDFKAKATHFPTAAVAWDQGATATIAQDIIDLGKLIRADSQLAPNQLTFGDTSWEAFSNNEDIQTRLNILNSRIGEIKPLKEMPEGGQFRGRLDFGNNTYDLWTYDGMYVDPVSKLVVPYVDSDKVIMRATSGRMDATFGGIPRIMSPDQRLLRFLPSRLNSSSGGIDMHPNVWLSDDREQLHAGVSARPLLIPTDIDSYGAIGTGV